MLRRSPISRYRDDEYHLVRLGAELDSDGRARTVAYAESQVGQAFGYLDMLAAGLHLLFGWPLRWVRRNHEICSSLVVKALQAGGLLHELDPALRCESVPRVDARRLRGLRARNRSAG